MNTGLLEQIRTAQTRPEIKALLERGKTFTMADERTRKRWAQAAQARWNELIISNR